jgi:hypothetical protein
MIIINYTTKYGDFLTNLQSKTIMAIFFKHTNHLLRVFYHKLLFTCLFFDKML